MILDPIGRLLARYLSRPRFPELDVSSCGLEQLSATIKKGDVLLVDGNSRISVAIKFITQSNWSHAALYIGEHPEMKACDDQGWLIEADVVEGVRLMPLNHYATMATRICRPVGLREEEIEHLLAHALSRMGHQYDLKNIVDLVRYLIQTPPVPNRWRRQLLGLGSGDPTRAICSSMIAEAFQAVNYPILPDVVLQARTGPDNVECYEEVLLQRHHTLFTPRDFDVSPYFQIVKPTIEQHFDPHGLNWAHDDSRSAE